MRSRRGLVAIAIEVVLATLLLGAAATGLWQLNRPLPAVRQLIANEIPEGTVVVDARGPLAYRQGHLPGARRLWARDLLAFDENAGSLAASDELERQVRRLDLEPDAEIVVYDDGDAAEAALVLLVLRSFGFDARLLDGGLRAWNAGGGELDRSAEPQSRRESGTETEAADATPLEFDRRLIVDPEAAHEHIAENAVAPLDVREREKYLQGHVAGAVNVPLAELLPGGATPRWSVLARALGPARITRDTHPLIYGENPQQAAAAWLALAAYGMEHIHVMARPFEDLASEGFEISATATPAATSTRSSSVCWR